MNDEQAVSQLMARYTRGADRREPSLIKAIFTQDGVVDIFLGPDVENEQLGHLAGNEQISQAVVIGMLPHPDRGWSHHRTTDHIVEVTGDSATLEAHFITYNTVGAARPVDGWGGGVAGAQGTITPIESGYYRPTSARNQGEWLITRLVIVHDLPYVFPSAELS